MIKLYIKLIGIVGDWLIELILVAPSLRGTKQSPNYRAAMQTPPVQFAIASFLTAMTTWN